MGEMFTAPAFDLHPVFKLDRDGLLTLVVGTSTGGFSCDGGQAVHSAFELSPGLPEIVGLGLPLHNPALFPLKASGKENQ
jgi:hypothetical protein